MTPQDPPEPRWPQFDAGRLDALQRRIDGATPGSWRACVGADGSHRVVREADHGSTICTGTRPSDARLIAHAPADLEWLMRELRHAWGREAAWRDNGAMWREWHQREYHPARTIRRPSMRRVILAGLLGIVVGLFLAR